MTCEDQKIKLLVVVTTSTIALEKSPVHILTGFLQSPRKRQRQRQRQRDRERERTKLKFELKLYNVIIKTKCALI